MLVLVLLCIGKCLVPAWSVARTGHYLSLVTSPGYLGLVLNREEERRRREEERRRNHLLLHHLYPNRLGRGFRGTIRTNA